MAKLLVTVLGFLALATVALAQGEVPDCPQPSPGEQGNVTFFPNTEDCHLYWMCDNGNLLNQSCGDQLIWNPDLNACDWDFNVNNNPCLEPSTTTPSVIIPPTTGLPAQPPVIKKQIPATKQHLTIRNPTQIKTLPHRRPVPRKPVTFIRH